MVLVVFAWLFSRPPLGAVLCGCPDCFALACAVLSVGWLSVRLWLVVAVMPSKCGVLLPLFAFPLSLWLALAILGRSFAVPCRFRWWGGVFARPLLFVAIWGICRLCSVFALAFGLWGCTPSLFLASFGGGDYPLKIYGKKLLSGVCWGEYGGFCINKYGR